MKQTYFARKGWNLNHMDAKFIFKAFKNEYNNEQKTKPFQCSNKFTSTRF